MLKLRPSRVMNAIPNVLGSGTAGGTAVMFTSQLQEKVVNTPLGNWVEYSAGPSGPRGWLKAPNWNAPIGSPADSLVNESPKAHAVSMPSVVVNELIAGRSQLGSFRMSIGNMPDVVGVGWPPTLLKITDEAI